MKITLIQTDIKWADPAANAAHIQQMMTEAPKSDIYVLPEMWSTGFATEPEGIAEDDGGESLIWMQRMADTLDAAVAGSIAVRDKRDMTFRNRFWFVRPHNGTDKGCCREHYDKHHLFTYGGEDRHYTAGDKRVVCEWRGVRFRLCVCYDLRFPSWIRNHEDYDCLLCVASWPTTRIDAWNTLLRARAIENQCFVAGVDRTGNDPYCQYCGGTQIIDPYGRIMETCETGKEMTITADIDMEALNSFRKKFPVLKDRDKWLDMP